jgi:hypothetical protein
MDTPLTQGDEEPNLTLRQRLVIGLVPSTVPAGVLLVALGVGAALGVQTPSERNGFEQIAGGALLITYVKEIFPANLAMFEEVVDSFGPTTVKTRRSKVLKTFGAWFLLCTAIMASAVLQAGFEGFPGMLPPRTTLCNPAIDTVARHPNPLSTRTFTPGDTVPYFLGFMVDGVVLAYDDNPVQLNLKLVKRLILSGVLAFDNFLDGFGLVPVLRDAFGGDVWWVVMILFSLCVLFGATLTAFLRHCIQSPMFHMVYFAATTISIIDGAMELTKMGFTVYVAVGAILVWFFLLLGDICDEDVVDEEEASTELAVMKHGEVLASAKA